MKKILLCNLLFIKRAFKKVFFLILLAAIPLICYLLKVSIDNSEIAIKAGIYVENSTSLTDQITQNLKSQYDSVHFESCLNINELKDKVASGEYECGYVFPSDMETKLSESNLEHIVEVYTSPGTLTVSLINEYVFSELFVEYGFNELTNFISIQKYFDITDIESLRSKLRPQYDYYMNGDDTFSFKYIGADNKRIDNTGLISSYVLSSSRGVIALFIMFVAFIGTFYLYKDTKTGVFNAFTCFIRPFCKMSEILSPTLIACISSMIAIHICGLSQSFFKELTSLLIYLLICTIYCFILYTLIPNQYIFAALIPLLILGSIIFCPIFIDISEVIPAVKYISWLFLPNYYL